MVALSTVVQLARESGPRPFTRANGGVGLGVFPIVSLAKGVCNSRDIGECGRKRELQIKTKHRGGLANWDLLTTGR